MFSQNKILTLKFGFLGSNVKLWVMDLCNLTTKLKVLLRFDFGYLSVTTVSTGGHSR